MFKISIFKDDDPFSFPDMLLYLKDLLQQLSDPTNLIKNIYPEDPDPYWTIEKNTNRMVDYRHSIPFQILNGCKNPSTFELVLKTSQCKYPLIDPITTLTTVQDGRVCLRVNNIDSHIYQLLFKPHFDCKYPQGKIFNTQVTEYVELWDEFMGGIKIIKKYNEEYLEYRNFVSEKIILE